MRILPKIVIMTPSNENEMLLMLNTGLDYKGPSAVRYPRGTGPNVPVNPELEPIEIGKANLISDKNSKIVILNFGALIEESKSVADNLNATLIDMRFVKPLDENLLKSYLSNAEYFVSIEDGSVMGGAGSAVQEFCSKKNIEIKSILFGIPDKFIEHASREEMLHEAGLTADQILSKIRNTI